MSLLYVSHRSKNNKFVEVAMESTKYDKKPEPGDLIEIFRGTYQHWAIYVGDGFVIHLAPPSEHAQAGAYSMMSVLHEKATVKKEKLYKVVGNDGYRINNLLDKEYEPRPIHAILRDAYGLLGRELPYSVFTWNCEHFVRQAVEIGGAAVAGFGIIAAVAAFAYFGSKNKEKQKH
ncbi:unnamed protein product [Leuciscus chuanchicus]